MTHEQIKQELRSLGVYPKCREDVYLDKLRAARPFEDVIDEILERMRVEEYRERQRQRSRRSSSRP